MSVENLSLEFVRRHSRDAAHILEALDPGLLGDFLTRIAARDAAHILRQLTPQTATRCLALMDTRAAAQAVNLLPADFAAMLMRRVEGSARHLILASLPSGTSAMFRAALRYSDAVVGSIMDPDVPAIPEDVRVGEVKKMIRKLGERAMNTLFIVDENKRLTGIADVRRLLSARDSDLMRDLLSHPPYTLSARASLGDLQNHPAWRRHDCIPVVDNKGLLLGALTGDTMERVLAGDGAGHTGETDLAGLALDFAEIFWSVCADMLPRESAKKDSRKD